MYLSCLLSLQFTVTDITGRTSETCSNWFKYSFNAAQKEWDRKLRKYLLKRKKENASVRLQGSKELALFPWQQIEHSRKQNLVGLFSWRILEKLKLQHFWKLDTHFVVLNKMFKINEFCDKKDAIFLLKTQTVVIDDLSWWTNWHQSQMLLCFSRETRWKGFLFCVEGMLNIFGKKWNFFVVSLLMSYENMPTNFIKFCSLKIVLRAM